MNFFPPHFRHSSSTIVQRKLNRKLSPKMYSLCSDATSKMHQMSSYAHCEEFMKKLPQHFDHSQAFIMKVTDIERHLQKCENKQHNEVKNDEIEHSTGTVQLLSLAVTAAFNNSL